MTDHLRAISERVTTLLGPLGWTDAGETAAHEMASRFTEVRLAAGEVLITAGELGEELFLVESGTLDVMANVAGRIVAVGQVLPGQAVGEMQFVLGGRRTATVRASTPVVAFRLARNDFEELQRQWPALHGNLLSLTRERIYRSQLRGAVSRTFADAPPAFAEELERVAEWVELRCGDVLFREGDAADGWYLIVTGRLRVIKEAKGSSPARILQEAGAAESLGEMAILSGAPRAATVVALRDSLVARIPTEDCLRIAQGHPQLLLAISRTLISRLHTPTQSPRRIDRLVVALLHTTRNPILDSFARDFSAALRRIRPTAHVTPAMLTETGVLGEGARLDAGHPSWLRFRGWLESVLLDEPFVVLDLGPDESVAAEHMIGQADHVVLLGDASSKIEHSEVVQGVFAAGTPRHYRRHHTLVLVHPAGTRHPRGTRAWLDTCNVDRHLHVRVDRAEDAARVARALTGRSIGVVLGGGGARGFAHLGVIRAFRELGLPVDYVGGTSMGSIMAGQVALGLNHEELVALNRPIVALRPFNEYTVPVVALLKTEKIAQSAKMAFGDTLIEDLWLPYFAVSANLTTATPCIHESGPTWLATRASGSLPGIAVPVVQNRELLVDGGIVDNLPVGIMHDRCGGGPVIAVDVSPAEDLRMTRDAFPSQWALLGERIRPGARSKELPSIADILMRTTLLASAAQRERSWREADLVLNPPIEAFGMLAFEQLDTLVEIGYQHAMSKAEQIRALIV